MLKTKFNKSFDDVLTQAYLFQSELVADAADFVAYSPIFDAPFPADFLSDIEAADALPTNEDDLNQQTLYSNEVDVKMEEARQCCQKLFLFVDIAWPGKDATLKAFGKNLYDGASYVTQSMINLLQGCYLSANSTAYKADLIAAGFLQTDITAIDTLAGELTSIYNAQQDFIRHSFERSENRIVAFNKVWDTMVKISNFSKFIFKDSPAKIEFYLLYPDGPAVVLPGKIQNLAYNSVTAKFTWQADTKAASYQIETSPDGSEWLQIYEGALPEYINTQGPGSGKARCRGVNENGSGSWSDNLDYTVPVPAPHIVSVGFDSGNNKSIVTFDTVAFADLYLIYQSVVPIGNPAGYFDEIGTPTSSPFYTVSSNNAMREYYYIKASFNDVLSVQSNIVYLDVPVV